VYDGAHARDRHHAQLVSLRALVALGVSGGMVPCPAALVVLLSALSIHRVGRLMTRFREDGPLIHRGRPLTSSAVMTVPTSQAVAPWIPR
jgi:hypothetical protein